MDTRQSIYDTLNNGRARRSSSLEDLEATLGGIEAKLERLGPRPAPQSSYHDDMAERMRRLSQDIAPARTDAAPRNAVRSQDFSQASFAPTKDAMRQSDAMVNIATELQEMRAEMRRLASGQSAVPNDWNAAIRKEIETIKNGLGSLAREDTLRSVESQWSQMAQRPQYDMAGDPAIEAMLARIDGIQSAISGLPQSNSLVSLEEKIRVMASAIDQLSRRSPEINGAQLLQIEDRLDEISRAIVASSVSVQAAGQDKAHLERLESRLLGLNDRIEMLINADTSGDVNKRIGNLSSQLDIIAKNAGAPIEQMARMAAQLETIATRINELDATKADPEAIAIGLEDRLYEIATRLEQSNKQTGRESREIFQELEIRLEELATKLNRPDQTQAYSTQILNAVEQRFADFSRQMTSDLAEGLPDPNFALNVERRLEDITNRLNSSVAMTQTDPDALMRLELQVQKLASQLAAPRQDFSQFNELNPRLAAIEHSLAANQDAMLNAARQAAEDVLNSHRMHGQASNNEAAIGLANDLKALEVLARKSDDRNTKTFEAIHETLLKLVDRLNSIETSRPNSSKPDSRFDEIAPSLKAKMPETISAPHAPKNALGQSASGFHDVLPNLDDNFEDFEPIPVRSPAEAAFAAAQMAKGQAIAQKTSVVDQTEGGFLAKLAKSVRRAEPDLELALPGTLLPEGGENTGNMLDTTQASIDRQVDTFGNAPDLNAIMKRVREERNGTAGQDAQSEDAAKSDYLAAARRAAKAASAEVEILRTKSNVTSKKQSSAVADLLQRQRKPIMMVAFAAILALTGLQLSKAFFNSETPNGTELSESSATPVSPLEPQVAAPAQAAAATENVDIEPSNQTEVRTIDVAKNEADEKVAAADVTEQPKLGSSVAPMLSAEQTDTPKAIEPAKVENASGTESTLSNATPSAVTGPDVAPIALREAAAKGDNKALFEIGNMFAEGRGVENNQKTAAQWYQKAADTGFAPAQFRLGSYFEKGTGVERSAQKAKELYQLAAEQGNAGAMHNLAVLYAMGAAGPADNDSAAKWFTSAAELGVKDSQFNLGILAAKGLGVPQNLEESYKWFSLAANAGDKDAAAKRDEIANVMRPEQLAKARATTELWKAKPVNPDTNVVVVPDSWKADAGQTAAVNSVDMVKAVRNIQAILNQNGYDAGAPDGQMGARTKKAIAAYQKDNGMPVTGEVSEALVKSLLKKVKS